MQFSVLVHFWLFFGSFFLSFLLARFTLKWASLIHPYYFVCYSALFSFGEYKHIMHREFEYAPVGEATLSRQYRVSSTDLLLTDLLLTDLLLTGSLFINKAEQSSRYTECMPSVYHWASLCFIVRPHWGHFTAESLAFTCIRLQSLTVLSTGTVQFAYLSLKCYPLWVSLSYQKVFSSSLFVTLNLFFFFFFGLLLRMRITVWCFHPQSKTPSAYQPPTHSLSTFVDPFADPFALFVDSPVDYPALVLFIAAIQRLYATN